MPMLSLNDLRYSLMAKVACRKNVYKVNGLLGKKEDDDEEEEERKKIRTKRKAFPQLCGKANDVKF